MRHAGEKRRPRADEGSSAANRAEARILHVTYAVHERARRAWLRVFCSSD